MLTTEQFKAQERISNEPSLNWQGQEGPDQFHFPSNIFLALLQVAWGIIGTVLVLYYGMTFFYWLVDKL